MSNEEVTVLESLLVSTSRQRKAFHNAIRPQSSPGIALIIFIPQRSQKHTDEFLKMDERSREMNFRKRGYVLCPYSLVQFKLSVEPSLW